MYPPLLLFVNLHLSTLRRPTASRPSPCSSLLLFPSYLSVFRFVRFRKKQYFHILTLVIALVSDLRKRQHARITLMLQGAFADVQQLAHITIVQPVRMLAFLSECLVATLGKAQDFISKLCPIGFCNDVIVHNFILLLFVVSNLSSFHRQR